MNPEFYKNFSLEGKKAIVIGASKGIGFSTSQFLANQGANVFGVSRDNDVLSASMNSLFGSGHSYLAIDMTKDKNFPVLAEELNIWGIPDIVIANLYSRNKSKKLINMTASDSEMLVEDLKYLFHLIPFCIPNQRKNKFGRWIGISSMTSSIGGSGQAIYSIKKNALESIFKTLAIEEGKYGITANIISPGIIATPGAIENYPEELLSTFSKMNVMGRSGKPEEIAYIASFLASPLASYITGVNIPACGGYDLGWGIDYAIEGKLNL